MVLARRPTKQKKYQAVPGANKKGKNKRDRSSVGKSKVNVYANASRLLAIHRKKVLYEFSLLELQFRKSSTDSEACRQAGMWSLQGFAVVPSAHRFIGYHICEIHRTNGVACSR